MLEGSKPVDGGHLILSKDERDALVRSEPALAVWIKPLYGGRELLDGDFRFCLWLKGIKPEELRDLKKIHDRLALVRAARLKSPTAEFQKFADLPYLFVQDRQPEGPFTALPKVSSENRRFIPVTFMEASNIITDKILYLPGHDSFRFAILNSTMHMAWMRVVAGRLESRYSYAPAVYNNFPWPTPSEAQRAAIERTAQGILDARAEHPNASLADLYDPLSMPPNLVAAHAANDRAVDAAYGQPKGFPTEAARLAFLFDLYQNLVAPLDATPTRRRPRARRSQG
jgi:hypothetical protein